MKKERNIGDVIDRVIALLDEEGDEGLRKRLTRVSSTLTSCHNGNYARIAAIWNDTEAKS